MEGHGLRRCHHHPSSSPDQPQKRYKKFTAVIHKDADHARSCSCPHPQRFRQICDFFSPAQHHLSCFNVMVVWVSNRSKIKTKETKDPPPSSSTTTPTSWSALQRLHCPRFAHIRGGGVEREEEEGSELVYVPVVLTQKKEHCTRCPVASTGALHNQNLDSPSRLQVNVLL